MKSYTPEEITEMKEIIRKNVVNEYEKNKIAWENKDKEFNYNRKFLSSYSIQSETIIDIDDIFECVSSLNATIKKIKEFELNNFFIQPDFNEINLGGTIFEYNVEDDDLIDGFYIKRYLFLTFNNLDELFNKIINNNFRNHIRNLMYDKIKHKYRVPIDCKLFELFMTKKIDWETFENLTYSNCLF